ncbi:acyl-CoA synthetase [Phreatobacter cathodiphilus]|uniref:Acyl-CoA synthetase n=1 Tax=Phreatobacter cathodiphilus TaxID=1868589 RepID=A0A2S0NE05_9HYPH|nr:AMP-binding protein [Phreatobacter cathodiphilus]AVO46143.1 acyl-CoA synthetase [Phreatobacter cathodiphilus]
MEDRLDEKAYLAMVSAVQDRRWPKDLPREPQYPFGPVLLTEHLARWAGVQPDKAAVNFYGAITTFAELHRRSDAFAQLLHSLGVRKGDRVAVFLSNCPQFLVAFYGILKLGAVHVPVNPMFKAPELAYELTDTGATVLLALDQLWDTVAEVLPKTSVKHVIVTSLAEAAPAVPAIPAPASLSVPKCVPDGTIDMMAALAAFTGPFTPPEPVSPDDIAALNYTGGTTGMPKGCIHTQGDMVYTAATTVPFSLGTTKDSTYLCYLPVFWVAGEVFGVIFPIFAGCTCVLLNRWDPVASMAAIDRFRVTHASFLVDGAVDILDHPDLPNYDLTSLERTGGVSFVKKLNPDLRRRWREVTGSTIREVAWGMTETHTCDTMNYGLDADDFDLNSQPVFVGFPVPGTEFKICDFETGALKPLGEEGEICIRSPSLFKGYWNRPEANGEVFRAGWFHTGDIGLYDEDGILHFLGRRKEMLKVNGMSVFPGELEAILGQYPGLLGSGVIGRPDEAKGEVPVAFVWLPEDQRNPAGQTAFADWVGTMMSSYKRPEIRFVDALPMTETGKVKKEQLKALL